MEKRVSVFTADYEETLEENINNFLRLTEGKLHDVKLSSCIDSYNDVSYVVLIIYTPEPE